MKTRTRFPVSIVLAIAGLVSAQRAPAQPAVAFKPFDFSSAGYAGGGVAIPAVAAKFSLTPSGRDDTRNIQARSTPWENYRPARTDFAARCCCAVGRSGRGQLRIESSGVVLPARARRCSPRETRGAR